MINYPRIFMADKITGITKISGRTKVYQATVGSLPTLANFNWAYQDGVADPRTLIDSADRSPLHRGRTHRLKDMTRLMKTTATTLATALTEIDASDSNDPKAFIDEGILYFSIVGGGDASTANIYVDATTGFVSAGTTESSGSIDIVGLEIRYGGVNLKPFKQATVDELFVYGSRGNCLDYSNLILHKFEGRCSGSASGSTGDILNGHDGSKLIAFNPFGGDGQDDFFSDHEGGSSRLFGGEGEFMGGTCLAPAYGSDCIAYNFTSRKNQRILGRKPGAFAVIGTPSQSGAPDDGIDTRATFVGCISIGDRTGFIDSGTVNNSAVCIDCKVYDMDASADYGYRVSEIRDCGFSSTNGVAKHSSTIAKNTTIVT